jgi:hypothetical protein
LRGMSSMVVDPRDIRHNPDGSLRPEHYEPGLLADHTGTVFQAKKRGPRDWNKQVHALMINPRKLECPGCGGDQWIIIADDHPTTGLMAFRCAKASCRQGIPPIEAHKPQMQDATAKKLGLWTPGQNMMDMGQED